MKRDKESVRSRWARLRFSIIGPLLASPPPQGKLQEALAELAGKTYRHPTTDEALRFGESTIERWYYQAKKAHQDPIEALARKVPSHAGTHPSISVALEQALRAQHRQHPSWSYQLHYDNIVALTERNSELGSVPSYSTVARFMKACGLFKKRRRKRGKKFSRALFEALEARSFEVEHVHALWHADFHAGSRSVLQPSGQWAPCVLLGVLDDRSRLCCHLQWYVQETAETFIHGLSQALLKRGLPRSLLTDNGAPMVAKATVEGLHRLGILHCTTLPYSPEQNAKNEVFWAQVEGRLMPMLEGEKPLTLSLLNRATQAWAELDYNRKLHSELGDNPLHVALTASSVVRPAPDSGTLRRAFRVQETRAQRISDGTITVSGVRFELPSRYRTLCRPAVRFAPWDLSSVELVDARTDKVLCELYPLDKRANADGKRRPLEPIATSGENASDKDVQPREPTPEPAGVAPLLQNLMAEYAATGLPPAYLPHRPGSQSTEKEDDS